MLPVTVSAVNHHQPRAVARVGWVLSDQIIRQFEVKFREEHALCTFMTLPPPQESTKRAIDQDNLRPILVNAIHCQICED